MFCCDTLTCRLKSLQYNLCLTGEILIVTSKLKLHIISQLKWINETRIDFLISIFILVLFPALYSFIFVSSSTHTNLFTVNDMNPQDQKHFAYSGDFTWYMLVIVYKSLFEAIVIFILSNEWITVKQMNKYILINTTPTSKYAPY